MTHSDPAGLPNPDSPIFTSFGKALLRQMQQSITTTTRTITYDYDGLQRLTSASENPGTTQTYSYDLAGNRTGVWVNGTRTQNLSYNAANQVNGWSYDAAGNLLTDGTTSSSYDALGRTTVYTTTQPFNQWTAQRLTYNADGTLVHRVQYEKGLLFSAEDMWYTQDLAAPLSQILADTDANDSTNPYIYGLPAERLLRQWDSYRTWYSTDALGSVRATLSDAGIPIAAASYDAWGVPETAMVAPFGFTGELQRGSDVWLRARWYGAGRGAFGARDPYAGDMGRPSSLMPYQYAYAAPTMWTDPSGWDPGNPPSFMFCNSSPCPGWDIPAPTPTPYPFFDPFADVDPAHHACNYFPPQVKPPEKPRDIGLIYGVTFMAGSVRSIVRGAEIVLDIYDFELAEFTYEEVEAHALDMGLSVGYYQGEVTGWSRYGLDNGLDRRGVTNYGGPSNWKSLAFAPPGHFVSGSVQGFQSLDGNLTGSTFGISLGASVSPIPAVVAWGTSYYTLVKGPYIFRSGIYPNLSDGFRFWDAIHLLAESVGMDATEQHRVKAMVMENARRWVQWKPRED